MMIIVRVVNILNNVWTSNMASHREQVFYLVKLRNRDDRNVSINPSQLKKSDDFLLLQIFVKGL